MTRCVFVGPSLTAAELDVAFDGIRLPPVRQGDVFRAVQKFRPEAIGILDGYFHQVPAVCHKEILWAMAQGIAVLGAASMGALRAAELSAFGMVGVGRIFAAYRDGALAPYGEPFEDDDEVAVIHGPAEVGYVAVSEAMVNVRVTLAAAATAGVIADATRDRLVAIGKAMFYPDRGYEPILAAAGSQGIADAEVVTLRRWLPEGRIDQKRDDALALLARLGAAVVEPPRIDYQLAPTTMWESVMAHASDV